MRAVNVLSNFVVIVKVALKLNASIKLCMTEISAVWVCHNNSFSWLHVRRKQLPRSIYSQTLNVPVVLAFCSRVRGIIQIAKETN